MWWEQQTFANSISLLITCEAKTPELHLWVDIRKEEIKEINDIILLDWEKKILFFRVM